MDFFWCYLLSHGMGRWWIPYFHQYTMFSKSCALLFLNLDVIQNYVLSHNCFFFFREWLMTTGSMLLEASSSQGMRSLWLNSSRSIAWARPRPSTLGSVDLCFREWHTLMTFFVEFLFCKWLMEEAEQQKAFETSDKN